MLLGVRGTMTRFWSASRVANSTPTMSLRHESMNLRKIEHSKKEMNQGVQRGSLRVQGLKP